MRIYETIFIVRPNVPEDDLAAITERTKSIIQGFDGIIAKVDKWGLRKLAYQIKKEQQGNYVLIEYTGKPEAVSEIERIFKIDDRILKFMTVKLEQLSALRVIPAPRPAGADEDDDDDR